MTPDTIHEMFNPVEIDQFNAQLGQELVALLIELNQWFELHHHGDTK